MFGQAKHSNVWFKLNSYEFWLVIWNLEIPWLNQLENSKKLFSIIAFNNSNLRIWYGQRFITSQWSLNCVYGKFVCMRIWRIFCARNHLCPNFWFQPVYFILNTSFQMKSNNLNFQIISIEKLYQTGVSINSNFCIINFSVLLSCNSTSLYWISWMHFIVHRVDFLNLSIFRRLNSC